MTRAISSLPVRRAVVACALAGCAAVATPVAAQCELPALVPPAGAEFFEFGSSLALRDGVAVIGCASGLFGGTPNYVFEQDGQGWARDVAPLAPGNLTVSYGSSVDVQGDRAVAAGQDLDDPSICGYVFERNGGAWELVDLLVAPTFAFELGGQMGIALDGDTILVAAPMAAEVYVFERLAGEWTMTQTLDPDVPPFSITYATSLSLHDGRAVVGGAITQDGMASVGTAWIFERQGTVFVETAQLVTSGGESLDAAGRAIAQDDDTIVLGAPGHDLATGADSSFGAVFVFERIGGTWTQTQFLTAPAPRIGDSFGASLALQGDALAVGAPFRDGGGAPNVGEVLVFQREASAWTPTLALQAAQPEAFARFGHALALDGDTLLVSTPSTSVGEPRIAVFAGVADRDDWTPVPGAVAGASGTPCLHGVSAPVVGGDAALVLSNAAPSAPVWLVLGLDLLHAPFHGGHLVPTPDILWLVPSDAAGNLLAGWTWPTGVPPGTPLWWQAWIADASGPFGYAASNGISVLTP